jgi:hypothetical protein
MAAVCASGACSDKRPAFDEAEGIPHFVAEVAALFAEFAFVEDFAGFGIERRVKNDVVAG